VAMVGGGSHPRPGEISLAHNGVLFLDELPEFDRSVLEALRQPLEEGRVTVARAARTASFPARFMLVAAMNPCPCGYYGDSRRACRCPAPQIERYTGRISGPLRDRIDLIVDVPAGGMMPHEPSAEEPSAAIRARILGARRVQCSRFGAATKLNSTMEGFALRASARQARPCAGASAWQVLTKLHLPPSRYPMLKCSRPSVSPDPAGAPQSVPRRKDDVETLHDCRRRPAHRHYAPVHVPRT